MRRHIVAASSGTHRKTTGMEQWSCLWLNSRNQLLCYIHWQEFSNSVPRDKEEAVTFNTFFIPTNSLWGRKIVCVEEGGGDASDNKNPLAIVPVWKTSIHHKIVLVLVPARVAALQFLHFESTRARCPCPLFVGLLIVTLPPFSLCPTPSSSTYPF